MATKGQMSPHRLLIVAGLVLYGAIILYLHSALKPTDQDDSRLLRLEAPSAFSFELLDKISSIKDLEDRMSPQYKAYRFMITTDRVRASSGMPILSRYALACLFFSLHPKEKMLPTSYGEISECSWDNIECNIENQVHAIKMSGRGLKGTIPSEIHAVSTLKTLDLSENMLRGSIPKELWSLSQLEALYLYQNRLTGPALHNETGTLSHLKHLYLGQNELNGTIPHTLSGLTKSLRNLSLHRNKMTGTIPSNMTLRHVVYFDLSFNDFSGTLPEDIGYDFVRAKFVYLDHNNLTGTVPRNYGKIGNGRVNELYLNDNKLEGAVPKKWVFPNDQLSGVRLHHNKFNQSISPRGKLCRSSVLRGVGELVEISADCNVLCPCDTLCDQCYNDSTSATTIIREARALVEGG